MEFFCPSHPFGFYPHAGSDAPDRAAKVRSGIVGETARLTAVKRELDAQEAEELNRQLAAIIEHLSEHPEVTVEYFIPDERKAGGAYVTVTGRVRHVSLPERVLVMEDGNAISMDDIAALAMVDYGES